MVNEDILGGIETAVAEGESVEAAMMGFYNSGYSREDIEWAAKAFQLNQFKAGPDKIQPRPKVQLLWNLGGKLFRILSL